MESLTLQNPHWEALTPDTRLAFQLLTHLDITKRFYLAGGTGLALHIGHRTSVDLDFFCEGRPWKIQDVWDSNTGKATSKKIELYWEKKRLQEQLGDFSDEDLDF